MSELYKAIAGSPITYLAGDISAGQTTIAVADDTALPDAPNICTIGYGEHIETIRYGAKSNGVLQDVTRGIEGTPRAWQSGTEVARFFTAYDHNSIIENFNSLPEIISNSNGTAFKFPSGLMVCVRYPHTISESIDANASINIDYTTPQPFISTPSVSGSGIATSLDGAPRRAGLSWQGFSNDTIRCTVVSYGQGVAEIRRMSYIAIGRWK